MTTQQIVEKLNQLKKQKGWTLSQLAEISGLTLGTINKIMSGSLQKIKQDKLEKLANAFGVSVELFQDNVTKRVSRDLGLVKIACISPDVHVGDCAYNCNQIFVQAQKAEANGVKIALFPELSITGYTCGDLFLQEILYSTALEHTIELCKRLASLDVVCAVGLPLQANGKLYNCAALLYRGEILGFVPKMHLPNYNEFHEARHFSTPQRGNTFVTVGGKQIPFGTKLLFENIKNKKMRIGVEICEDAWVQDCPAFGYSNAGATILLNLSASNETVAKANYRRKLVEIQSGKTCTAYAYASCNATESTSKLIFAGHNIICENSELLAESKPFISGYAEATIDFDFLHNEKCRYHNNKPANDYMYIPFEMDVSSCTRNYPQKPFIPSEPDALYERCETILTMQAYALKKRIEHVGVSKLVIGVSGGSDSTLALMTCVNALKLLGRPMTDIISITMPCFGTTERTLNNSIALAKALGTTVKKIDISKAVTQHLVDIDQDANNHDIAFENAQARERTQILMDVANQCNGLVIGTGDQSELALGWCTYNGDQMSMYGVNASIPKTLVKVLLAHIAKTHRGIIGDTITDIVLTPVSPELLPPNKDGTIKQITEDAIGPYILHDYFMFM
ncbi:MAG: NAD(+) synthase, partial [Clostridia bacterium]|nr:NAD(+) synthase [Clostridia bacterium]